ncbi:hypothetical protein [Marininema halotolerans]|uniref:Uncharacterized protein n=1 Tax=Marininema halotolerans TaxID=1155944 RepID=A0A1I6RZJ3_9BACL|nr:hypothetical protein [Marininema halotolerans]SFS70111.1 hypothetical protein SAMN05444972_10651 [Marininema halotolerans]
MLDTVYVDIRHMNFWFGVYGFQDKSCNDEITIYSDANMTNTLGYFEITTHESLTHLIKYQLDDEEDGSFKREIEKFLNDDSQIFYSYIYPRDDEDLLHQVSHFAPLNRKNHKPIYIDMWTKLSDELDINEIKKCAKILVKEFLHENILNIKIVDIPTYDETKESYEKDYGPINAPKQ